MAHWASPTRIFSTAPSLRACWECSEVCSTVNAPHASRYIAASATSTGEILRVYNLLAHLGVRYQNQALSI